MTLRRILLNLLLAALATSIGQAADLTDNLISVWKFDEASGDAIDSHGLNLLTQVGTIGAATGKVYATARSFDRVNVERFSVADNPSLSSGTGVSVTMGAWVKLASDPGLGQFMMIIAKDDASANREYYLGWHGNDKFAFQTWNAGSGGGSVSVETATTVAAGIWYFVQAGFDTTTGKIWIRLNDSVPVTASQTQIFDGAADFRVGSNSQASPLHALDGQIGPAFFYKRFVSGGELLRHYNANIGLVYNAFGANVSHWLAATAATPTVAGVPKVDVTHVVGQTATVATMPLDANVTRFGGNNGFFSAGRPEVNTTHWSGTENATPDTAGYPKVTIKDGAGNGELDTSGGALVATLEKAGCVVRSVVAGISSQTVFDLQTSEPAGDGWTNYIAIARDTSSSTVPKFSSARRIVPGGASGQVAIESAFDFTLDTTDYIEVYPPDFETLTRVPDADPATSGGLATLDANLNVQADVEAVDDDTGAAPNAESFFDGSGYGPLMLRTTISSVSSQSLFTLESGEIEVDAALVGTICVITDNSNAKLKTYRTVTGYVFDAGPPTSAEVTLSSNAGFTIGANDIVEFVTP